ncbi:MULTISPECIES: helix-turn-helix transcriptional regulator [Streptomyces]|uniref:Helix-turn-helix transcriptional regulator n=1 Tax=Streptomyces mordarskii TaxID=1226758 RepID=A0ABP3M8E9_9ACTN|nr:MULTISPECIES: helix-turn-helix transcriptional regulator [Streptomyces]QTI88270.1 helix-turn-helix domain-containing protein [Streptomyces sp. AgN23]WTB09215.1 helix-turn-helix transcriptional regulator [Streptomyces antimycoticus]
MPADTVREDIRTFLTSRRARITPKEAGLPDFGGRRQVSGLRRSEVAQLAAISVEYYTRIERGNVQGVSEDILDALSHALRLNDVERAHLAALVRAANNPHRVPDRDGGASHVRPNLQQILDAMTGAAAFVRNAHLDILATNALARALYTEALDSDEQPPNLARFVFRDPRARRFYRDWEGIAHDAVGSLRTEAARTPADTDLADLIDELTTCSEEFAQRWDAHDVEYYRSGQQRFHHPGVGDLDLDYDALEVPADPGLTIVTYTLAPTAPHATAFLRLSHPHPKARSQTPGPAADSGPPR